MNEITTTKNLFGVEDISHKPRRMQGDSFRNTPLHINRENDSTTNKEVVDVPEFITVERAIEFYEGNSDSISAQGKMYSVTAQWLRELMELRATKLKALADSKTAKPLTTSLNDVEEKNR